MPRPCTMRITGRPAARGDAGLDSKASEVANAAIRVSIRSPAVANIPERRGEEPTRRLPERARAQRGAGRRVILRERERSEARPRDRCPARAVYFRARMHSFGAINSSLAPYGSRDQVAARRERNAPEMPCLNSDPSVARFPPA